MFLGIDLSWKIKFVPQNIYLSASHPLIFHFGQTGKLKIIPALWLASGAWGCVSLCATSPPGQKKVDEGIFLQQPLGAWSTEASSWLGLRTLSAGWMTYQSYHFTEMPGPSPHTCHLPGQPLIHGPINAQIEETAWGRWAITRTNASFTAGSRPWCRHHLLLSWFNAETDGEPTGKRSTCGGWKGQPTRRWLQGLPGRCHFVLLAVKCLAQS